MSRDLARRAIGEKALLDVARALNDDTRQALADAMEPGDRIKVGTLGYVTMSDPKPAHRVTDRAAFLRWVQEHHPDAVIHEPRVVPAFEEALLSKGADENGEVPDGVEVVTGRPTLSAHPTIEAKLVAESMLRRELEA